MNSFMQVFLLFIATALFGSGINLGYRDLLGPQTACFSAGAIVLIFVFLSQFKRFKGPFGIEGEMWEKEMEEAHEIAEKFKALATVVARPLLTNSVRLGRWDSALTRRELHNVARDTENLLRNAGTDPIEIEATLRDYRRFTMFDMVQSIRGILQSAVDDKIKPKQEAVSVFGSRIAQDQHEAHAEASRALRETKDAANRLLDALKIENSDSYVENITASVNECDLFTDGEKQALLAKIKNDLDDLSHFRATGQIRRPDVWFSEPTD